MSCSLDETSTLLAYCQTEVEKHKYKEGDKILTLIEEDLELSDWFIGTARHLLQQSVQQKQSSMDMPF